MWTGTVPFYELKNRGRWKVEFFCSDSTAKNHAAYEVVPLGEVLSERKEALDPQQHSDWLFNYLGLENVASFTGDLVEFGPKRGRDVRSRSKVFRKGDILYGRLRPNLNKVFIVEDDISEGICSGEFYVLVANSKWVLPHFARWLLTSTYVQSAVTRLITGSALPRLQLDDLMEIEIPLPPLKEQEQFERVIIRENSRRRQLLTELMRAPQLLMNAIVEGLESGRPMAESPCGDSEDVETKYDNPLPINEAKGRKKGDNEQGAFGFLKARS